MSNLSHAIVAPVVDGWTGAVTVTIGAAVATVTPSARTSAVAVFERVAYEARRIHGAAFTVDVTSASKFLVTMPSAFTLAATGTTASKTGLTVTQSGSASYTLPGAVTGALLPTYGAALQMRTMGAETGGGFLSGGLGFTGGLNSSSGALVLFDTLANASTLADTLADGGTYDVAVFRTNDATDVMTVERVRVTSARVELWGRSGVSYARARCSVREVSA